MKLANEFFKSLLHLDTIYLIFTSLALCLNTVAVENASIVKPLHVSGFLCDEESLYDGGKVAGRGKRSEAGVTEVR